MKVLLNTLNGPEHINDVTSITEFNGTIVLALDADIEYNLRNDFPSTYSIEVTPQSYTRG